MTTGRANWTDGPRTRPDEGRGSRGPGPLNVEAPARERVLKPMNATSPRRSDAPNVAETLGQVTWLFSQSPLHRELRIKDLEWSVMPAVLHGQLRIFRFGPLPGGTEDARAALQHTGFDQEAIETLPLGIALWAYLSETAEAKLERSERLTPQDWRSGDRLWLVELISPFATPENRLSEAMLADLVAGPFRGRSFKLHRTDPQTGERKTVTVPGTNPS